VYSSWRKAASAVLAKMAGSGTVGGDARAPLLLRLIDKTDPTASLKHAAFGAVVTASIAWLSYSLWKLDGKISTEWNYALGLLLAAVALGKIVGSDPSPAPTVGAVPTTIVETGEPK
jgi:hypothetical protein